MDQTQTAARFATLFQAQPEFVDEIFPRLGSLELTVICQGRSAAPQKSAGDLSASPRCEQRINSPNAPTPALQHPRFQIKPLYAPSRRTSPSPLDVGRWTLNVGRSVCQPLTIFQARLLLNAPVSPLHQYVSVTVKIPLKRKSSTFPGSGPG